MTVQPTSRTDPARCQQLRMRDVLRGVAAAALLLLGAVDALVTALIGIPPLTWLARRIGRELAAEYRRGREDAIDAEVIDEEDK